MDFLIGIIGLIVLIILTTLYVIWIMIVDYIKLLFGYKKYEYSKILSHGIKDVYEWHKTDEKALERHKDYEFVSMVKPTNKRLKPLK